MYRGIIKCHEISNLYPSLLGVGLAEAKLGRIMLFIFFFVFSLRSDDVMFSCYLSMCRDLYKAILDGKDSSNSL